MGDIPNIEKNRVVVEGPSGTDRIVESDGSGRGVLYDGGGVKLLGQKAMAGSIPMVIASDQSAIPISQGLPEYLSSMFGYATGINQPTAGSDNPLIFLKNPSGSGKNISIKFVAYGIAVANVLGTLRIYKNPTTTANGTSKTIVSFGGGTTAMQIYEVPTVTANGTLLGTYVVGQNSVSILVPIDFEIKIAPNETILITGNPGSNNRQAEISMRWLEL